MGSPHNSYDEAKTTQAAAYFLKKAGGEMQFLKLLKLLYLADREALLQWGRPISFDHYVSMNQGPVLSRTYEIISGGVPKSQTSYWLQHLTVPSNYRIHVQKDPGVQVLSKAEVGLLEKIFGIYGNRDQWDLVDNVMHKLPEWEDPQGSATPIQIHDILKHGGKTELEALEIERELESVSSVKEFFNSRSSLD